MLRIGICDDSAEARLALRAAVSRFLSDCTFYEFSTGEGADGWLQKHPGTLDLLFLDIEMPGISGMDAARRIRSRDADLLLVFVTGYPDYVFDGYAVGALDYLIKPVQPDRLHAVLGRAQAALGKAAPSCFVVQNADGMFRVLKRDILYFYSDRRLVHLVSRGADYAFYDKLDTVAEAVGPDFVRIHQRYLVRADAPDRVEDAAVWLGTTRLPISRANRQAAMAAFARAMLGEAL